MTYNVKDLLLSCDMFINNSYLDRYAELIRNNLKLNKQPFKTNLHHIIPKCYYKLKGIDIDDSITNKVNLLYVDHIRAHYYLCRCTTGELQTKCYTAFNFTLNKYKHIIDDIENEFDLTFLQDMYVKFCEAQSSRLRGKPPWNKGKQGVRTKGCLGQHWYNNGVVSVLSHKCPEGFISGRLSINKGQVVSPITREKQRKAKEGRYFGKNNPKACSVDMLTLQGEYINTFDTIKDAEQVVQATGVGDVIKGRQKTCGGYKWRKHIDE